MSTQNITTTTVSSHVAKAARLTEILQSAWDKEKGEPCEYANITAMDLCEEGLHILPIHGKNAPVAKLEKAPSTKFTSKEPITSPVDCDVYVKPEGSFGVVPPRSSDVIIIDADTPAEVQHLNAVYLEITGEKLPLPTVITPGIVQEGKPLHEGGGHWWFVLPQDTLSGENWKKKFSVKDDEDKAKKFDIYSEGVYVLTPPSERTEGFYQTVGEVIPAGEAWTEFISSNLKVEVRVYTPTEQVDYSSPSMTDPSLRVGTLAERITKWSERNSWEDLCFRAPMWEVEQTLPGQDSVELRYLNSTSSRSAAGYPYSISVFSGTVKSDYPGLDSEKPVSKWMWAVEVFYGGDKEAALEGEGLDNKEEWKAEQRELRKASRARTSVSKALGCTNPKEDASAPEADTQRDSEGDVDTNTTEGVTTPEDAPQRDSYVVTEAAIDEVENTTTANSDITPDEVVEALNAPDEELVVEKKTLREIATEYARENIQIRISRGCVPVFAPKGSVIYSPENEDAVGLIRTQATTKTFVSDDMSKATLLSLVQEKKRLTEIEDYVDLEPRFCFIGEGDDFAAYISLEDKDSRAVKITSKGWGVLPAADLIKDGVHFASSGALDSMKVEKHPQGAHGVRDLFAHMNIPVDKQQLVLAWLMQKLCVGKSASLGILMMTGQPGSGKSSSAELLKALIDPSPSMMTSLPRAVKEASAKMSGRQVTVFDNIGSIPRTVSDEVLSPSSTGGSYEAKALYTNGDLYYQSIHRAVILTAVDAPSMMADLRSRTVFVPVDILPHRGSTQALARLREEALPRLRGALFSFASLVIAKMNEQAFIPTSRLSDLDIVFQATAAVLSDLGLDDLINPQGMDDSSTELAEESIPDVISFMTSIEPKRGRYEGRVGEIYAELKEHAHSMGWGITTWSATPKGFGKQLTENLPYLEKFFDVTVKEWSGNRRIYTMTAKKDMFSTSPVRGLDTLVEEI